MSIIMVMEKLQFQIKHLVSTHTMNFWHHVLHHTVPISIDVFYINVFFVYFVEWYLSSNNTHILLFCSAAVEKTIQELCVGLSFTQLFNILANVILFFFVVWPHFQTLETLRVCISEREKSYLLVFAAHWAPASENSAIWGKTHTD